MRLKNTIVCNVSFVYIDYIAVSLKHDVHYSLDVHNIVSPLHRSSGQFECGRADSTTILYSHTRRASVAITLHLRH